MSSEKWNVKTDCKAFTLGEKSKEQFIVVYTAKLHTLNTDDTTQETASKFLRDCLQAEIREFFPKFTTDVKASKEASFEQQNWLKYYERRRKTEIPAIIAGVYGKAETPFSLETYVKNFLKGLDKQEQRQAGLAMLQAMTEI